MTMMGGRFGSVSNRADVFLTAGDVFGKLRHNGVCQTNRHISMHTCNVITLYSVLDVGHALQ